MRHQLRIVCRDHSKVMGRIVITPGNLEVSPVELYEWSHHGKFGGPCPSRCKRNGSWSEERAVTLLKAAVSVTSVDRTWSITDADMDRLLRAGGEYFPADRIAHVLTLLHDERRASLNREPVKSA